MFGKSEVALAALIALASAFPASAATKQHRVTHVPPAIYNAVPDGGSGGCSPTHAPFCSNICTGPGPCAPPDSW
jgi:hypothetical protein